MVSLPKPADCEAGAESDNPHGDGGDGHEAEEVPEAQHEIPAIDLGREQWPRKWRGADEPDEEPAVGYEILDRCPA